MNQTFLESSRINNDEAEDFLLNACNFFFTYTFFVFFLQPCFKHQQHLHLPSGISLMACLRYLSARGGLAVLTGSAPALISTQKPIGKAQSIS